MCAHQAAADFRDELLEAIGLIPETLAEGPGETAGTARPMGRLVRTDRGIMIHRAERALVRHLDVVEGRMEEGAVAAVADLGRDGVEEGVDGALPDRRVDGRDIVFGRIEIGRQA